MRTDNKQHVERRISQSLPEERALIYAHSPKIGAYSNFPESVGEGSAEQRKMLALDAYQKLLRSKGLWTERHHARKAYELKKMKRRYAQKAHELKEVKKRIKISDEDGAYPEGGEGFSRVKIAGYRRSRGVAY